MIRVGRGGAGDGASGDGSGPNTCERVADGGGYLTGTADDSCMRLSFSVGVTAYRFEVGHRLRLQVCSGAHPRWGRNLGTGEPPAESTRTQKAVQTIYHDARRPSHISIPIALASADDRPLAARL